MSARDTELVVKGAGSLHAGFVRLEVRNEGRGEHGIELVRLKRPLTTMQLLQAFTAEKRALLEALGGIQQAVPGRPWQMTERLGSGSYALLDFARTARNRTTRAACTSASTSHRARRGRAARHSRRDRHARLRLRLSPAECVLRARRRQDTNLGKTSHEISLVRVEPGHTQHEVLSLILAGASKPPEWASIVELLSVLDPAKTAYVRLDLSPGRYVALCLMNEPRSQSCMRNWAWSARSR